MAVSSRSRVYSFMWFVLWLCCGRGADVTAVQDNKDDKNSTRGVDEFLTSLTQMIGTALNADARYSQLLLDSYDGTPTSMISDRPNRPVAADYFDTGRPPFLNRIPPQNFRPYPPSAYLQNGGGGDRPYPTPGFYPGPSGFLGGQPPYPYPGQYPNRYPEQNSILQALSSISRHDDLRCVPRLLCEVSSGTRPGYYQPPGYYQQQQQQQSSIPFLTKDALITLLTVLNFVDDSPLLMFGRAALLGYNARGDSRSCTSAYPTCPRDPDQLINYLNNHNGGFFRFFNQQLPQYAPQYGLHQPQPQAPHPLPPPPPAGPYRPQSPFRPGSPAPFPNQPANPAQLYYAPQYPLRPRQEFAAGYKTRSDRGDDGPRQPNPRILSGSADQYYDVPSVQDLALDVPSSRPSMTFPRDDNVREPSRFAFPPDDQKQQGTRQGKKIKMIFPDRTGTGGLRADLDQYGNYKGVYYADGAIKFVDDQYRGDRRPSKIRLPSDSEFFDNRLPPPREKRPKLHFPTTTT